MCKNLLRLVLTSACVLSLSSCASRIHESGDFIDRDSAFSDREQVQGELGVPIIVGDNYEIYKVRRHLPDNSRAFGTYVVSLFTLGTAETILLPAAIARWTVETAISRYALFYYDTEDNLTQPPHGSMFYSPATTSRRLEELGELIDGPPLR